MKRNESYRRIDPPYSSIEKGEVEHCAVTKYCDERVEDSSFSIKSERERLQKSQPYMPQNFEEKNKNFVGFILLILGLISVVVFFLLM